ncbi:hypothetical protein [Streptomyces sp. NPDC001165]|uniref:hypothetical protein n=1 Tax=Streptomyces sp. NPDC001165 TaxID=3364546 RepID=UPI0036B55134
MPLVVQVDGKGVVMRPEALREATRRAAAKAAGGHRGRLAPGEKPNRKRMATVACVFDITGARWGLAGAEAVLRLRTLVANGDLDDYWRFHTAREHQRLYPAPNWQEYSLISKTRFGGSRNTD